MGRRGSAFAAVAAATPLFACGRIDFDRPAAGLSVIYRAPRLGATALGSPTVVENQPAGDNMHPMLSRDGATLVFASSDGTGYDLWHLTRTCQ